MVNRRDFVGQAIALGFFRIVLGEYRTPDGDEPIEILSHRGWTEYPFDELLPGDRIRRKREPNVVFSVLSCPEDADGTRQILCKAV